MHLTVTQAYELFAGYGLYIESDRTASKYHFQLTLQLDRLQSCSRIELRALVGDAPPIVAQDTIDPLIGLHRYQLNNLANDLYLPQTHWHTFASLALRLYRVYDEGDALEIVVYGSFENAETTILHRANVLIDKQAHFRHAFMAVNDSPMLHTLDATGEVGVIGSGSGLTLATLDAFHTLGANLIKSSCVAEIEEDRLLTHLFNATKQIIERGGCRCIVINLFCTFVNCDLIAHEIIHTQKAFPESTLIVCIRGLKADEAKQLLDAENICNVMGFVELVLETRNTLA